MPMVLVVGFNGLPCSRSGRSEKRPSMIHEGAFFWKFFHIFSPDGAASPFQTVRAHRKMDSSLYLKYKKERNSRRRIPKVFWNKVKSEISVSKCVCLVSSNDKNFIKLIVNLYWIDCSKITWFWQRRARLLSCLATSGWSLPRTFSRISRARLQSGSASLYLPLLPYNTAKLFSVAAT